jgi:hypothetical protein
MDEDKSPCGYQLTCEDFRWYHKVRNHDIRMTKNCIIYMQAGCPLGSACNINKIKMAKEALALNDAYHV